MFGKNILKLGLFADHKLFNYKKAKYRETLREIVEKRKKSGVVGDDLVSLLLQSQKTSEDPHTTYSDTMIFDEFLTFYLAGTENASLTIVSALYLIDKFPEYKKRLLEEVRMYLNNKDSEDTLNKMVFIQCFLKETLRYMTSSVSTVPVVVLKDAEYKGYKFKKGDKIACGFDMNFQSTKYHENPEKFLPERWLTDEGVLKEPFAYLPFSAGPRNCLGQHFVMVELKIMMAEFLARFEAEVPKDYKLVRVHRFNYCPREPIPFILKKQTGLD